MAAHRILSVGQCGVDHAAIGELLRRLFDAEVASADSTGEALAALRDGRFDLVLVNRVFDSGGSGLDLIASIRGDDSLKHIPVMLVSDLSEAQRRAEKLGAAPGFGKSALGEPETRGRIVAALERSPMSGLQ